MSPADRPLAPADGTGGLSARVLRRIAAHVPTGEAVCVGFSGGLDSSVLLDIVAASRTGVRALHVHHGLSPNADAWAAHCVERCRALGVPIDIVRATVARDSGLGLEAAARAARHAAFAARAERCVLLAHHRDDQAETVLLQMARGTGIRGLAAMPEKRALAGSTVALVRPMLDAPRGEILAWAKARGLAWIEDESNAAVRHDRNYLRHAVAPLLDARFGGWRAGAARLARHAAGTQALLDALATLDGVPEAPAIPLALRADLEAPRRANALRAWLARNGLPMLDEGRLAEVVRQAWEARADAQVAIPCGGRILRRHRDQLCIDASPVAEAGWRVPWRLESQLRLGVGRGVVTFAATVGEAGALRAPQPGDWYFAPRAGGERLRLAGGGRTRTLKNLLQEHGVAHWRRPALPLLFRGAELVWVPGVGIAAAYACGRGEPGLLPALEGFGEDAAVIE